MMVRSPPDRSNAEAGGVAVMTLHPRIGPGVVRTFSPATSRPAEPPGRAPEPKAPCDGPLLLVLISVYALLLGFLIALEFAHVTRGLHELSGLEPAQQASPAAP